MRVRATKEIFFTQTGDLKKRGKRRERLFESARVCVTEVKKKRGGDEEQTERLRLQHGSAFHKSDWTCGSYRQYL